MKPYTYIRLLVMLFILPFVGGCDSSPQMGAKLLNEDWLFYKVPPSADSSINYSALALQDNHWDRVTLPHTANIEPYIVNDQWQGISWYRRHLEVSEDDLHCAMFLKLGAAMNIADVWINGEHVTTHLGGFLPIVVDMSQHLTAGDNVIAVRLDNNDSALTGPKPLHQLDFNTYGGLYRNAEIIRKPKVHITDPIFEGKTASGGVFVTYPAIEKESATLRVQTHVRNSSNVEQRVKVRNILNSESGGRTVLSTESKVVSIAPLSESEITVEFEVKNPRLWSVESPELYSLQTSLVSGGKAIDNQITSIGIRKIEFVENQLYLNGEQTFLRGVNRHQEYPYIGYALSDEAQWRDAVKIKQAGFDYVRLSHYPMSEAFMHACNELGLLVLDAIPGWQFFSNTTEFREYIYQSARDMIRRDRNHPCVLAWEVSLNETGMPDEFVAHLNAVAREEYPSAITAGWTRHAEYDIYLQARQHRDLENPEEYTKPLIVSEYGDWEYYAKNAGFNQDAWGDLKASERTSRQLREYGEQAMLQQAMNLQEAHNDNLSLPAFADGYWVMFDYNRGYADDLESSGVMSIERLPKWSRYMYESQRSVGESRGFDKMPAMVKIASYWDSESIDRVKVFSNCEEVELFINGRSIGRSQGDDDRLSTHIKQPPFTFKISKFEVGELKAVGYIDGEVACEQTLRTPEQPTHVSLDVDISEIEIGCNDTFFVYLTLKDKNGTVVPRNGGEVTFSVEGAGEIVGDAKIDFKAGVAFALVRSAIDGGTINISAVATIDGEEMKENTKIKI